MEGDERKDGGAAVPREDRDEDRGNGGERKRREDNAVETKRREGDHDGGDRKRRERERETYHPPRGRDGDGDGDGDGEGERRRGHRGGSRSRSRSDSLNSTERKKKRIEESKRQESTIFVGDLDPETTAEQLTELFKRFGCVLSSKIKEHHCYGFVTFEKKQSAEASIAAGQNRDGIELLNGKQVYVSWALGSLPEWKKGIGGFTVSPGKDLLQGHRSRKGVVKPSVLAAATAAAAAKANAVLASMDRAPSMEPLNDYRGRAIVAYDDLL